MCARLAIIPVACVLLAGCGGEPPAPALAPVRLAVDGPTDGSVTQGERTTVTGTVRPASAVVLVGGEEATTSADGRFTRTVALTPGVNLIDVEAGAPRRAAGMTAVRVTREVPVEVPDVAGETPAAAERRLRALGFDVAVQRGGGLLDELVPGSLGVCGTDPDAGERLRRGTTVTVEVRKAC